eukprot:scaffold4463_cov94-Skeletonema_dohrnii-CCMP3373.AAC.1
MERRGVSDNRLISPNSPKSRILQPVLLCLTEPLRTSKKHDNSCLGLLVRALISLETDCFFFHSAHLQPCTDYNTSLWRACVVAGRELHDIITKEQP